MTDVEKFHLEGTDLHRAACFHFRERGSAQGIVARQLALDQAEGQRCPVNGHRNIVQNMMDRSNVILMPVCDDNPHYLILLAAQIFIIGNDVIDPEHIVAWKHHARIHDQYLMIEFIGGHVFTHFPKSTQGNNLQFSVLTHTSIFYPHLSLKLFIRHWRLWT